MIIKVNGEKSAAKWEFSDFVFQVSKVAERMIDERIDLEIKLDEQLALIEKAAQHIERLKEAD